ncbi:MAG TPA: TolC family protein, partial [Thermoanaerobaculia bacterium]|nr:TolC family protein [Thermoanaerobaculia bacterium]
VEQADAAARIVRDRYEHGLTTITEQLRAENALVRARLGLLAARYDYVVGYAELLRATGDLNDITAFD